MRQDYIVPDKQLRRSHMNMLMIKKFYGLKNMLLGEKLVLTGFINDTELQSALSCQAERWNGGNGIWHRLGVILVGLGYISRKELRAFTSDTVVEERAS
jgi:hypothetical protein